jgi:hypothetical protein
MPSSQTGFFAYAGNPPVIGQTIEAAVSKVNLTNGNAVRSWKSLDIPGHFISEEVLSNIDKAEYLVADISVLNFNVTYEIAYAIGKNKRILIVKNSSIAESGLSINNVGIFDTLGYETYQNSSELANFINNSIPESPLNTLHKLNTRSPVYLLVGPHKTDYATQLMARVKKAKLMFRSFDPNEQPRLSAHEGIEQIAQSYGVIIPLLSDNAVGSELNNMRAAFLAGLARGMNKPHSLLQFGDTPVPIDYRDFVKHCNHPKDIDLQVSELAASVAESFQKEVKISKVGNESFLQSLDLGASSAENEMRTLEGYYLQTDQFLKSIRGEANIVVGRKGSGKSAIFLQVRDEERAKIGNIVLDLKPDGYKLIKFKEMILSFLEEGTFQHTIMAFWEYVLLLEICYKILESDRENHLNNHHLYEPYRKLANLYHTEDYDTDGDFSERMSSLMEKITSEYTSKYSDKKDVRLSSSKLTELLYCHDVKELSSLIIEYMSYKDVCWLLFDNIDKGWPTSGLEQEDLLIIRALIDATKKIQRQFSKSNSEVFSIIFLRNDVYELLVKETSDRGKEAKVLLDWTDPDLLRELLRLRIVSNNLNSKERFEALWPKICVSHYEGEESSQYLIDRSLMRPRFLLNLVSQCKSFAINLNHENIETKDLEKGLTAYSTDLLSDIGYEISDIEKDVDDVLYAFISSKSRLTTVEVNKTLIEFGVDESHCRKIIDLLLWYGFLGLIIDDESKYIYDFHYNMQLVSGILKKKSGSLLSINPAFWPALMISD